MQLDARDRGAARAPPPAQHAAAAPWSTPRPWQPRLKHCWQRRAAAPLRAPLPAGCNRLPILRCCRPTAQVQPLLDGPVGMALYEYKNGRIGAACVQGGESSRAQPRLWGHPPHPCPPARPPRRAAPDPALHGRSPPARPLLAHLATRHLQDPRARAAWTTPRAATASPRRPRRRLTSHRSTSMTMMRRWAGGHH